MKKQSLKTIAALVAGLFISGTSFGYDDTKLDTVMVQNLDAKCANTNVCSIAYNTYFQIAMACGAISVQPVFYSGGMMITVQATGRAFLCMSNAR
jgi:hypothetical protein